MTEGERIRAQNIELAKRLKDTAMMALESIAPKTVLDCVRLLECADRLELSAFRLDTPEQLELQLERGITIVRRGDGS